MASQLVQPERLQQLNDHDPRQGDFVLYWMEHSQRSECNHALEHAIRQANQVEQPLVVLFVVPDTQPGLTLRQATFMLEGLEQTQRAIRSRGIQMVVRCGDPVDVVAKVAKDASQIICDRGYLRDQRQWRQSIAKAFDGTVTQVESDAVVPIETTSDHREYAARTIRPKIHSHLDEFLVDLSTNSIEHDSTSLAVGSEDLSNFDPILKQINIDRDVPAVSHHFRGGTSQANARLRRFIDEKLQSYEDDRSRPECTTLSHMSMYLHFGQISPLAIALKIRESSMGSQADRDSYIEELIVRRELSKNFTHFCDQYDSFACLPDWAAQTLDDHRDDSREHHYTRSELEAGETHDEYWNASMQQMRETGYMHNHMRMYWGKQILAWTNTPDYAHRVALELNNRYFLDGNDPNSFANVAWLFGNHDRAFGEHDVFGKVRIMTPSGLNRKADPEAYVERVQQMVSANEDG